MKTMYKCVAYIQEIHQRQEKSFTKTIHNIQKLGSAVTLLIIYTMS